MVRHARVMFQCAHLGVGGITEDAGKIGHSEQGKSERTVAKSYEL